MEARCYRIVITSNQSDRWGLERSARFHAADGLVRQCVCMCVCIDKGGRPGCVWWCVLECQVCIYQCVHWFSISEGRLNLLSECECKLHVYVFVHVHKCFPVMYVCSTHTLHHLPKPSPRHTLDHWSFVMIRFDLSNSSMRRFFSGKPIQHFSMKVGSDAAQWQIHWELLLSKLFSFV